MVEVAATYTNDAPTQTMLNDDVKTTEPPICCQSEPKYTTADITFQKFSEGNHGPYTWAYEWMDG